MLFHTWPFVVFFLVVYPIYILLRRTGYWLHWLLAASYVFYAWWNPLYLFLILYSTLLDYTAVVLMERSRWRKPWLVLSIVNNLTLLGFFKYAGFITESINAALSKLGAPYAVPEPDILLPVGISFFVFQSMSYTIDYYRGQIDRERSFIRYAAFVSLFPQLVAGPIERARALLRQLRTVPPIGSSDVADGLSLFVVGLFKKVAIADYLALYVEPIYASPDAYGAPALMLATFAFAWQIYCDFSGYTDMARGVARMMGIRLMLNFNNPYLATGLSDFWSRWHISLSTWFRDYVYVSLGGNRARTWIIYRNLFLTFVISGLWHGAAWTFVIWGTLHGMAVMLTRRAERSGWYQRLPRLLKQIVVFLFVCFAWIFFRAKDVGDAWLIVQRVFGGPWEDPAFPLLALVLVFGLWAYQFAYESRLRPVLARPAVKVGLVVVMLVYVGMLSSSSDQAFIYFQF